ncbi:MAG: two-component system response regulator [Spirochaetes bacterium GWF1_51_8]|nr:MAG: two-component system response regulator [Spirochaetes bacterium GWF1_51_8]
MKKKLILLVEDNELNRTLIRDLCTYYGYRVIEATNGADGVRMAAEINPDLILMDIQMPLMSGYSAIQKLKENPKTKHLIVIAVTSFAMVSDKTKILAAGVDDFITKPIDTRLLPKMIERYIGPGG